MPFSLTFSISKPDARFMPSRCWKNEKKSKLLKKYPLKDLIIKINHFIWIQIQICSNKSCLKTDVLWQFLPRFTNPLARAKLFADFFPPDILTDHSFRYKLVEARTTGTVMMTRLICTNIRSVCWYILKLILWSGSNVKKCFFFLTAALFLGKNGCTMYNFIKCVVVISFFFWVWFEF